MRPTRLVVTLVACAAALRLPPSLPSSSSLSEAYGTIRSRMDDASEAALTPLIAAADACRSQPVMQRIANNISAVAADETFVPDRNIRAGQRRPDASRPSVASRLDKQADAVLSRAIVEEASRNGPQGPDASRPKQPKPPNKWLANELGGRAAMSWPERVADLLIRKYEQNTRTNSKDNSS